LNGTILYPDDLYNFFLTSDMKEIERLNS
jgi:hypothetical protein